MVPSHLLLFECTRHACATPQESEQPLQFMNGAFAFAFVVCPQAICGLSGVSTRHALQQLTGDHLRGLAIAEKDEKEGYG